MRVRGTDRKAVAALVARSEDLKSFAKLYPDTNRRVAEIVTSIADNYAEVGIDMVFETQISADERAGRLADAHALTLAEARLALHIADGGSLSDYASARGITRNTARNQLQAVFDKTDVRRQAELVRLLADF